MPLADLLALIDALSARIDKDGENLGRYEALTRYALIDPLLRGLGWDTSDPAQVFPEYPVSKGFFTSGKDFADYALLGEEKPAAILEAKSLGTPLRDTVLDQTLRYCWHENIRYAIATDGQHWEIYDTEKRGADNKGPDGWMIVEFDIKRPPAEVCLLALALWRPGVLAEQVRVAETPVLAITEPGPEPAVASPGLPPGWTSLDELQPQKGDKPAILRLPDGHTVSTTSWSAFISELAAWLVSQGRLSEDQAAQYKKYGSGSWIVSRARKLVGNAGLDPKHFWVRLQD